MTKRSPPPPPQTNEPQSKRVKLLSVQSFLNGLQPSDDTSSLLLSATDVDSLLYPHFQNASNDELQYLLEKEIDEESLHFFMAYLMNSLAKYSIQHLGNDSHQSKSSTTTTTNATAITLSTYSNMLYILLRLMSFISMPPIRKSTMQHFSIALYHSIPHHNHAPLLKHIFKSNPHLGSLFQKSLDVQWAHSQMYLLPNILNQYFTALNMLAVQAHTTHFTQTYLFCCRVLELCSDLLQQWVFRKYVSEYCIYRRIYEMTKIYLRKITSAHLQPSPQANDTPPQTVAQITHKLDRIIRMVQFYSYYLHFEDNDIVQDTTSDDTPQLVHNRHYESLKNVQSIAWKHFPAVHDLAIANPAQLESREYLVDQLAKLSLEELRDFASKCRLIAPHAERDEQTTPHALLEDKSLLIEIFVSHCEKKSHLNFEDVPVFPTEEQIIEESDMLSEHDQNVTLSTVDRLPLPLPKLNLQFLNFKDYVLKNFFLYRLELAHQLRTEINLMLASIRPFIPNNASRNKKQHRIRSRRIRFAGSHSRCMPVLASEIIRLEPPLLGQKHHSQVLASVRFHAKKLSVEARTQWEGLKQNESLYLCTIVEDKSENRRNITLDEGVNLNEAKFHMKFIRGCKFQYIVDQNGNRYDPKDVTSSIDDTTESTYSMIVEMDAVQFGLDTQLRPNARVYEDFNLIFRREQSAHGNDTNIVLECLRNVMRADITTQALPEFMSEFLLGHTSEADAVPLPTSHIHTQHVFQNTKETEEALSDNYDIQLSDSLSSDATSQLFTFSPQNDDDNDEDLTKLEVSQFTGADTSKQTNVCLTAEQQRAVFSGIQRGFTQVEGAECTGKLESASRIIIEACLNFPNERHLVVCRNTATLSDILYLVTRQVSPDKCVVLHRNAKSVHRSVDYSVEGREKHLIQMRKTLLQRVFHLAKALKMPNAEDVSFSCESSGYFFASSVLPKWEKFVRDFTVATEGDSDFNVSDQFPFSGFMNSETLSFSGDIQKDFAEAQRMWATLIRPLFSQLEHIRTVELIRSKSGRHTHILSVYSRVIFTTTTELCVMRDQLMDQQFTYDSAILLESEQNLEIEAMMALLSQKLPQNLKRVVMLGDACRKVTQVSNFTLQQNSQVDQSMFLRLLKLQAPRFSLSTQFVRRPSLVNLTRWMYGDNLKDAPSLSEKKDLSPSGLTYNFQFINVEDYRGTGDVRVFEGEFQNLGEAEYAVQLFMYMRLKGHHANKIAIFTPFDAQRELIIDVLSRRCKLNPVLGMPGAVYSSLSASQFKPSYDHLIMSLVRTETDPLVHNARLWNSIFANAKCGLYVFGRTSATEVPHLRETMNQFLQRPTNLCVEPDEDFSMPRQPREQVVAKQITNVEEMGRLVVALLRQRLDHLRGIQEAYLDEASEVATKWKRQHDEEQAKKPASRTKNNNQKKSKKREASKHGRKKNAGRGKRRNAGRS